MKLTGYKLAFMVNGRDRVEVTLHADTVKERIIEDVRDQLRDACYRDAELLYLEFQIAREMAGQVRLTAPEIKFFLTALKKGDPDTAKHKKTLIAIFVNAIYLYDDKITLIFNSGDKPVTITSDLLNDIEKQAEAVPVGERFVYDTNASIKSRSRVQPHPAS